jgi:hypothetical protein
MVVHKLHNTFYDLAISVTEFMLADIIGADARYLSAYMNRLLVLTTFSIFVLLHETSTDY